MMKPRERWIVTVLAGVMVFVVFSKVVYAPLDHKVKTLKSKISKMEARIRELKAEHPQLDAQKHLIQELEEKNQNFLKKIEDKERFLPGKESFSSFLTELTRLAAPLQVESIRQKTENGEDYSRVFVEISFRTSYHETVEYIRRIEKVSPFLRVDEVEIMEPAGKTAGKGSFIKLTVSTLLGETSMGAILKASEIKEDAPSEATRDIFRSKNSLSASSEIKEALNLEGITYRPLGATAIISGEVVREGSKIGAYTVKKILTNGVVVADVTGEHMLNLEG